MTISGFAGNVADKKPRKKVKTPKGFDSIADFLNEMRRHYDDDISADRHNRVAAAEDIEFTYGDDWDADVRAERERKGKPCISLNRLPAFVGQVLGSRLLNETEIRVFPDHGGDSEIATIREAIIRSIFKNSNADFARDEAMKYQVISGMGAYSLSVDYCDDDVDDQEIKIKPISDPMNVVFDRMSVEPTGADAEHAFVVDRIPRKTFEARYPWANPADFSTTRISDDGQTESWFTHDSVMVVAYWRMVEDGMRVIAVRPNGIRSELDPDVTLEEVEAMIAAGEILVDDDGNPRMREIPRRFAQMYLCSGSDILDGPYNLPISSIPVFRVPGWELRSGSQNHRWGLVRFTKDIIRMGNYWESTMAESLIMAPNNKWVAAKESIQGYEDQWENSHMSDGGVLTYNSDGPPPTYQPAPPVNVALMTAAQKTVQDLRDITNLHEASLGQKSNEVSGRAIQARQQAADLGTFIYHDRLRLADERCARLINELIPYVYDTYRVLTLIDPEDKQMVKAINDPYNTLTDVTAGKYRLTVTTGPSTVTKRIQSSEELKILINSMPQLGQIAPDIIVKGMDLPAGPELERRLRMALPPGMVPETDITPEMKAAQEQSAKTQQQEQEIEMAKIMADIELVKANSAESLARAEQLRARAYKDLSDAEARQADVESRMGEREAKAGLSIIKTAKETMDYE